MDSISLEPIGVIHTPFKEPKEAPNQPGRSEGARGKIEIYPEYVPGLKDLDGFSHITLLFYFHLSKGFDLMVTPHMDNKKRGLFATRAPRRPNPIGISVVKLERIEGDILHIINLDMVDGTPLLDIKPYVRDLDPKEVFRIGWLKDRVRSEDIDIADDPHEQAE
jgi:tRNA-Thr(GGU) m(6)t(6)A37 methyltransferase TsaA